MSHEQYISKPVNYESTSQDGDSTLNLIQLAQNCSTGQCQRQRIIQNEVIPHYVQPTQQHQVIPRYVQPAQHYQVVQPSQQYIIRQDCSSGQCIRRVEVVHPSPQQVEVIQRHLSGDVIRQYQPREPAGEATQTRLHNVTDSASYGVALRDAARQGRPVAVMFTDSSNPNTRRIAEESLQDARRCHGTTTVFVVVDVAAPGFDRNSPIGAFATETLSKGAPYTSICSLSQDSATGEIVPDTPTYGAYGRLSVSNSSLANSICRAANEMHARRYNVPPEAPVQPPVIQPVIAPPVIQSTQRPEAKPREAQNQPTQKPTRLFDGIVRTSDQFVSDLLGATSKIHEVKNNLTAINTEALRVNQEGQEALQSRYEETIANANLIADDSGYQARGLARASYGLALMHWGQRSGNSDSVGNGIRRLIRAGASYHGLGQDEQYQEALRQFALPVEVERCLNAEREARRRNPLRNTEREEQLVQRILGMMMD